MKKRIVIALLSVLAICLFVNCPSEKTYNYPNGYSVKPLGDQLAMLRLAFPELSEIDLGVYEGNNTLPDGAEGLFLIPDWQTIAPTYGEAVNMVFAKLDQFRLCNFIWWLHDGSLRPNHLRRSQRSAEFWDKIRVRQRGGIFVIPAQLGRLYQGQSVQQARYAFNSNEFGLGVYEVGIMLLTHPERLKNTCHIWIN